MHSPTPAVEVIHGDALEELRAIPDASVDAVVTDPPYGLEFMGKDWDGADGFRRSLNGADVGRGNVFGRTSRTSPEYRTGNGYTEKPRITERGGKSLHAYSGTQGQGINHFEAGRPFQQWCEAWARECLRVLKPGGHMLAFGGTRTYHRLAVAVEDAGFEIRDSIAWMYATGFPKSLNVSKAIDKAAGAQREVVGRKGGRYASPKQDFRGGAHHSGADTGKTAMFDEVTAPATPEAEQWEGWGTALKPAHEPIVVARKPLAGTVARNVLEHGTGALNVDACRIDHADEADRAASMGKNRHEDWGTAPGGNNVYNDYSQTPRRNYDGSKGRWPANVVLDEHQAAQLDAQSGTSVSRRSQGTNKDMRGGNLVAAPDRPRLPGGMVGHNDKGGASRFFFVPKAGRKERVTVDGVAHPTVKPVRLMSWLVRLVCPPGGVVLDPFAGSGTTAEACIIEGVRCITIERDETYLPLIRARIARQVTDPEPEPQPVAAGAEDVLFDL